MTMMNLSKGNIYSSVVNILFNKTIPGFFCNNLFAYIDQVDSIYRVVMMHHSKILYYTYDGHVLIQHIWYSP